jgi:hypothetical protein
MPILRARETTVRSSLSGPEAKQALPWYDKASNVGAGPEFVVPTPGRYCILRDELLVEDRIPRMKDYGAGGGRRSSYCHVSYQSCWVVDEDATAQRFVGRKVEQRIDELAFVWHAGLIEEARMRPIGSPDDAVGCDL